MEGEKIDEFKGKIHSAIITLQTLYENNLSPETAKEIISKQNQLEQIQGQLESELNDYLINASNQMKGKIDQAIHEMQAQIQGINYKVKNAFRLDSTQHQEKPGARLVSQKVHKNHEPLLNQMMESKNFRTIYHILIAVMINLCVGEMIRSYNENGILLDLSMFTNGFARFHLVVFIWGLMFLWSLTVVYIVGFVHENIISTKVWMILYGFVIIIMLILPPIYCWCTQLSMINSIIVTCEMSRMTMKMHSYLREKLLFGIKGNPYATWIPDYLVQKGITVEDLNIPNISISKDRWIEIERFTFFHFCPTLIYRDSYPRIGTKRRWDNILYNLFNIIGAMIFTYIIFQTSCVPNFKSNWNSPWSVSYIIDSWFKAMIPGTFLLVLGFFGILHSWQNMWAEIILFADRCFYEDWWNVSSFATYYRKWNMVVHEFLYYYILQDLNRFTNGRVTVMQAYAVVFLISAWVHEYIIIVSFKIFYPVLLIMFGGPGVIYTFIPRKDNNMLNIFVWIMFFIGNGFLLIFYSWEYFARQNIDLTEQYGWYGFFIPHSLVNTDLGS